MNNTFTIVKHRDYISLYYKGRFVCNCDNMKEVREEMKNVENKDTKYVTITIYK